MKQVHVSWSTRDHENIPRIMTKTISSKSRWRSAKYDIKAHAAAAACIASRAVLVSFDRNSNESGGAFGVSSIASGSNSSTHLAIPTAGILPPYQSIERDEGYEVFRMPDLAKCYSKAVSNGSWSTSPLTSLPRHVYVSSYRSRRGKHSGDAIQYHGILSNNLLWYHNRRLGFHHWHLPGPFGSRLPCGMCSTYCIVNSLRRPSIVT
jgi:hypothetical protein